jgi:antitoxin component of RelBE/YafQ-DinJ toxin-antitoxin module
MARTERLNLRMDERLKKKIQAYCERNHLTISDLVTQHFVRLLEQDQQERSKKKDAEQI